MRYKLIYNQGTYEFFELLYVQSAENGFCWVKAHGDLDEEAWIEYSKDIFDLRESAIRAEKDRLNQEIKQAKARLKALAKLESE